MVSQMIPGSAAMNRPACAQPAATRGGPLARAGRLLAVWRQRQSLARLDAHLLKDLGLSEADVHREARRWAWDAPQSWRR